MMMLSSVSASWASPRASRDGRGRGRGRGYRGGVRASIEVEDATHPFADVNDGPKNLILIGGRGCGKSSVCRRIQAFDKRFKTFVLDDLIVYEAGMSIPAIVEAHGWRYFRDLEYKVCQKAASAFDGWTLIDAGGGVVVDLDENGNEMYSERKVEALKANGGKVVFLDRDIEYLCRRIAGDSNRPDLSATASFTEIMERRHPCYSRAADIIIDVGRSADDNERPLMKKKRIASRVLRWYYDVVGEDPPPLDGWFDLDV